MVCCGKTMCPYGKDKLEVQGNANDTRRRDGRARSEQRKRRDQSKCNRYKHLMSNGQLRNQARGPWRARKSHIRGHRQRDLVKGLASD